MGKIVNALRPFIKGIASIGEGWASMFQSQPSEVFHDFASKMRAPPREFTDGDKHDADAIRGDWEAVVGKWGEDHLKEHQQARLKLYRDLENKRFND